MSFGGSGGSSSIAGSSDVFLSGPTNNQILSYNSSTSKWRNATISGSGNGVGNQANIINVQDYGAIGNGSADDTAAIITARNAVLATLGTESIANAVPSILYFPPGNYKVTSADALMMSPTNGTAQPLRGLTITGAGKRTTQITFSTSASSSSDPRQNNLMTLANRVRGLRVSNIAFNSTNANQSLCYMWCSSSNDGTEYPNYGSGAQNDIIWDDILLTGSWLRGWGFDGDSSANQNSEQTWRTCYFSNSTTFGDAAIRSGFAPFYDQQDQFLNYNFYDCQFEYASGDFFVADKGGFINCYGGSYIMGINTTAGGTWFKMSNQSHFYTKHMTVTGTRFEFRNLNCKLIDTYWAGSSAHITFTGILISVASIPGGSQANHEIATFHSTNNNLAFAKFLNCFLPGNIMTDLTSSTASGLGILSFEMCGFTNYASGGGGTLGTSGTFLRQSNGTPKYRFQDCYATTNGSN